jgi:hypothetical protein
MKSFYVIQRAQKYLTYNGGYTPHLAKALQCPTREEAARHQAMHRSHGKINLVEPKTCEKCQALFDPFYPHTCPKLVGTRSTRVPNMQPSASYIIRRNFNNTYLTANHGWSKDITKASRMCFVDAQEIQQRLDREPQTRGPGIDSTHTVCLLGEPEIVGDDVRSRSLNLQSCARKRSSP